MRVRSLTWFFFSFVVVDIVAASKLEADLWTGYSLPVNEAIREQCGSYPATGNFCRIGGMSFGTGLSFAPLDDVRTGLGFSYLPISDGTLKVAENTLVHIGASYAPVLVQARYDFRFLHFQVGSGYAIALERPRVVSGISLPTSSEIGVYCATGEIGFRTTMSENAAFFASLKYFALIPPADSAVMHILVPSIGIQANMAD